MFDIENIKDAIKTAIQMEKDGYSFYKKAAAQTNSDMGKTIFEGLAADEQMHLGVFEKMFEETVSNAEWKDLVLSSKKYAKIPIFPKDLKEIIDEIIEQEKNHYSILEGEFNHINSTGYWFELDYLGT
jgi:rubrerythrin